VTAEEALAAAAEALQVAEASCAAALQAAEASCAAARACIQAASANDVSKEDQRVTWYDSRPGFNPAGGHRAWRAMLRRLGITPVPLGRQRLGALRTVVDAALVASVPTPRSPPAIAAAADDLYDEALFVAAMRPRPFRPRGPRKKRAEQAQ
jgi:hypothetical protein